MTPTQLAIGVAERVDLSPWEAVRAVQALFGGDRFAPDEVGLIADALVKGQSVEVEGFGTWSVRTRAARDATHVATGERIRLRERREVVFRAAPALAAVARGE